MPAALTGRRTAAADEGAHGVARAEAGREARHRLDRLSVGHLAHRGPARLSGGQARGVSLAGALAAPRSGGRAGVRRGGRCMGVRQGDRSHCRRALSARIPRSGRCGAVRSVLLRSSVGIQGQSWRSVRRPAPPFGPGFTEHTAIGVVCPLTWVGVVAISHFLYLRECH